MKQHEEREWNWCSDCTWKVDNEKRACKDCYLRFPEKEVEREISRISQTT